MTKRKRKKPAAIEREDVTLERAAKNGFTSAGMARRVIPVIDTLAELWLHERTRGQGISPAEHAALAYYRAQASLAEKSPIRSNCDFTPKGGRGPGIAIISAMRWTHEAELELSRHGLLRVVRAVAVDDQALWEFCVAKYGGRDDAGTIAPRNRNKVIPLERLNLRYGAGIVAGMIANIRKAA